MSKKVTIAVTSLIGVISMIVGTSCSSTPSPTTPIQPSDPIPSPTIITPTDVPEPTEAVIEAPVSESCPWITYFYDGDSATTIKNEECMSGEKGINISDDLKKLSFFLRRSSAIGTYGVCRDISDKENLKFTVSMHDKIVSSRILITISPEPIPTNKLSFGVRIQPELIDNNKEKGIWVKLVEYKSDGFDTDIGGIEASADWKRKDTWTFNFVVKFDGSQGYLSVNKKALSRTWPINYSDRYLCFAYQQTPTPENASELEAFVELP